MSIASEKGHLGIVEILASLRPTNIDQADHEGFTALYMASQKGHSAVVKFLLKHRADPNRAANNGSTPLLASSMNGHTEVCRCLIKYGAKIDVGNDRLDGKDWSPITLAKEEGHADTVALLERRLTPCAHCGNTAQQSGVHEKMKVCSLCRSVHYCSKQCSHAAWVAAGGGHSKECKRLGTEKRGLAAWLAAKRRQREPKQKRKPQPKQKASAAAPASASSASAPTTSPVPIPSISSDSRCANCGKTAAATGLPQLLRCSKCKSVSYCGAACQRVHWKAGGHKAACKKIQSKQQRQQSAAADE